MKVKTKSAIRGGKTGSRTGSRTGVRGDGKRRDKGFHTRKRFCRLCADHVKTVDYKDAKRLESFINDRGKIVSTRLSGTCAKHQRRVAEAIRRARYLSLIPYTR